MDQSRLFFLKKQQFFNAGWSLCSPAAHARKPSLAPFSPERKQYQAVPPHAVESGAPQLASKKPTVLLPCNFRSRKNRELNSSCSWELQKSPNKAKISQHSRQLSGIKFMIKGYSKHILVMLKREQSKKYTCWSNETSFGKHNGIKCLPSRIFRECINESESYRELLFSHTFMS